ncbi:hypothetical protein JCM9279_001232 [Rhodotorula babjevae]
MSGLHPAHPVELPPFGEAPRSAIPTANGPAAGPPPPAPPRQHQPAPPAHASTSTAPGPGPKRTTPACQRCRRGKVKCVTVDGVLPCQVCVSRGHADSCVRGEKGKAADDRTPYVRKRPAAAADLDDPADSYSSSFSSAQHASRRTSYQGPGGFGIERASGRGASLGVASGSGAAAAGGGGAALAGSQTPPSPAWSPQAVPAPLRAAPAVNASSGRVKGEEGASEGVLPPLPVLLAGCECVFEGYFQLGFLHRPSFIHQLSTRPDTVSTFLLLAILSVSARFVPALVAQHDFYAARAHDLVLGELVSPSLAVVHGLILLGVHDYGNGVAFRSRVLLSGAREMADALNLDKDLPGASVIDNEVRRRTWHFLSLDANFVSTSSSSGSSFDPLKVPVPLPSHEQDFSFGVPSRVVQFMPGATSVIAQTNPTVSGEASLLGALLAVVAIFGRAARALASGPGDEDKNLAPWDEDSLFQLTQSALDAWLASLDSTRQKWSTPNLLAYRNLHLDLGFWHCWADFHAAHILARRAYLEQMIEALAPSTAEDEPATRAVKDKMAPAGPRAYWAGMAEQLVAHAFDLVELQEEVSRGRPTATGMTPHLSFCVYVAATILNYLRVCPWLCPSRAASAPSSIATALEMLQRTSTIWPVAERWHRALCAHVTSRTDLPGSTSPNARADLHLDARAGTHRQHAPVDALGLSAAHEPSPAGQMDAASALAAMSSAAGPPRALAAGPVLPHSSSSAAQPVGSSTRSDAMSGLLRAAAAGAAAAAASSSASEDAEVDELSDDAPAAVTVKQQQHGGESAAFGSLHTPHSERGPIGGLELGELRTPDFGDLDELRAFLGGYEQVGGS